MPFGEVKLVPGVNLERTATLLEAGYSASQLIRFKDSLAQKYGGWRRFFPSAISGLPRDLHAWEDLNLTTHLSVGTTTQLNVITGGGLQDITPRTFTSDIAPAFHTVNGSTTVQITDANLAATVTVYDSILFNTPVSVGGMVISGGPFQITQITGANSYDITVPVAATANVASGGAVPVFTTTNNSAIVSVLLANHGFTTTGVGVDFQVNFPITTTGNGVTVQGTYTISGVTDANNFTITVTNNATAGGSFSMNAGNAEIVYYINIGPPAAGAGFGLGGFGAGGFGLGTAATSVETGSEITATDWTSDNWGEILLACPAGGGIYQFDPTAGFVNAGIVATAPPFNGGAFVSVSTQILMCWGSTQQLHIGIERDPLLINWSDQGNFTQFVPLPTNQAGGERLSNGSKIVTGMAVQNQNLFWTDIDLWASNYLGPPFVWGFNKIGAGAGAISSHAVQPLRSGVFWMGTSNFYSYSAAGVNVLPCPVWDFVFQNMNTAFSQNVRAMPNTPFNEAGWLFPSSASTSGECDSYVKMNITEPGAPWDYGSLQRSAWIDQTILGPPIGATSGGIVYQHETTNDADGQPLVWSFTTGLFYIAEGEDFAFVDQLYPDFKWGTFAGTQGAQVMLTVNVVNFPGATPTTYGPFTVTQATQYVSVRIRGRQMSFTVGGSDIGSFARLGKCRYRYSVDGRQ